ncbi:MAG TPA: hypothetical protein ENN17_12345 [bacterium]|nr:hypothetical protein [bacterium]
MIDRRMAVEGYRPEQEGDYVARWVNRELLCQEARRLGFHRAEGLDLELEMIEKEFLIQRLLENTFAERIRITDEEVTAAYEAEKELFVVKADEVRLYHVLTETREEANLAYREIQAGKPFVEVARARSVDIFREQGGDMGYIAQEQVIPEVAQAAFRTPRGGLSPIFRTSQGYHILRVADRRSKGEIKPLSEVQDEVRRRIRVNKERAVYFDLLYQLQNRSKIYIAETYHASGSQASADGSGASESGHTDTE